MISYDFDSFQRFWLEVRRSCKDFHLLHTVIRRFASLGKSALSRAWKQETKPLGMASGDESNVDAKNCFSCRLRPRKSQRLCPWIIECKWLQEIGTASGRIHKTDSRPTQLCRQRWQHVFSKDMMGIPSVISSHYSTQQCS